jgi:hypothetical protein
VSGGHLLLGQEISLSYRKGSPPPRQIPTLKVSDRKPYKVLQVAGISSESTTNRRFASFHIVGRVSRYNISSTQARV